MPKWEYLRRFLNRNAEFLRHGGNHDIYIYRGNLIRVSRSSGEISRNMWRDILKHELCMTNEEFREGLK